MFLPSRWTILEKVPGDVASQCWPDLGVKSSHVGVDVDRLAYPLHRPMTCSHQMRGQGLLSGTVLSSHVAMSGGALLGDVKLSGLDICGGIDRLGTCVIEFYTKSIAFTRICLPYVGIIMVCMHVSLVELPFQKVMDGSQHLSVCYKVCVGSYSRVLFC
jgi:hypothetical protein